MESKISTMVVDRLREDGRISNGKPFDLEGKVEDLFNKAGILEELSKLPEDRLGLVTDGIITLWEIDSIGRKIEGDDKEKLQGSNGATELVNDSFRNQIAKELEIIDLNFHGSREWLPESVKCLIDAVLENNSESMYFRREGIYFGPSRYYKGLTQSGDIYRNLLSGVFPPNESKTMVDYVSNEREESLGEMRSILYGKLSDVVSRISS